jgi:hypothetical protein
MMVGFLLDVRATKLPAAIVDVWSKHIDSVLDAAVANESSSGIAANEGEHLLREGAAERIGALA